MNNYNLLNLLDNEQNLDELTKLNNFGFFKLNYSNYLSLYPNSRLIFIDFENLKDLNTSFGHEGGNLCFVSFGEILKKIFLNSLLSRKHGDEFLILTNFSYEEIEEKFSLCQKMIKEHFNSKKIPIIYNFNAGIVDATFDLEESIDKADITMYNAKSQKLNYIKFDSNVYETNQKGKAFINQIDTMLVLNALTLSSQRVFKNNMVPTDIIDIYSRNQDHKSIFMGNNLSLLQKNIRLRKLDYHNLEKIISKENENSDNKMIINIHSQSVVNLDQFFFDYIIKYKTKFKNFILCIIINDFSGDFDNLYKNINFLNKIGFTIALSSLDFNQNNPILNIWRDIDVSYIKINRQCWKKAQSDFKTSTLLKSVLSSFDQNKTNPIFMRVETEEEINYISTITDKAFLIGNALEEEKPF